ncbi:hypothetical protein BKA62DRAFT_766724 [Auriculariales sp. MPI-PUGE-AT-0066]|nr:hypothetical protein BKA62DRAFT_766724 [Auriculariales sp. MPI-PUGE-AT-0066]
MSAFPLRHDPWSPGPYHYCLGLQARYNWPPMGFTVPSDILLVIFDLVARPAPLPWPNVRSEDERARHRSHLLRSAKDGGRSQYLQLAFGHTLAFLQIDDGPKWTSLVFAQASSAPDSARQRPDHRRDKQHRIALETCHSGNPYGVRVGLFGSVTILSLDFLNFDGAALLPHSTPNLTRLTIYGDGGKYTNVVLVAIAHQLKELCILENVRLPSEEPVLFPQLQSLALDYATFPDYIRAPSLQSLTIDTSLSCDAASLAHFTSIRHLCLYGWGRSYWACSISATLCSYASKSTTI